MNMCEWMSRSSLDVVGRKAIHGIGNIAKAKLLCLSQESVSTVTWSHLNIIIRGRFLIFPLTNQVKL